MLPTQVSGPIYSPLLKRQRLLGITVAIVMVCAIIVTAGATMARAVTGSVSGVTLSIVSDGTAPFDVDDAAGNDSAPNNGIVRTSDFVTYQWAYSVASAGDITFTQTLPSGMRWDASSTTNCREGAGAIVARVLTCTIANASPGAGAYNVKAKVLDISNGGTASTSVVATTGGASSTPAVVTVSATPKVAVDLISTSASFAVGTGANAGVAGYRFPFGVELYSIIDGAKGVRGLESLQSPLTFTLQAPAGYPLAVPSSCASGIISSTQQPGPSGGGTNNVINSGVWACSQPGGPGTAVTVTVSGANTTLDTYPSRGQNGGTMLDATKAYFAVGTVTWWVPQSALPSGANYTLTTQLTGYDPSGLSGASNYGAEYAPAQQPGAACISSRSPSSNCASSILNITATNLSYSSAVVLSPTNTAPATGATSGNSGDGIAAGGQKYTFVAGASNRPANGPVSGVQLCSKWDPALSTIDLATPVRVGAVPSDMSYVIEYGNHVFANDNARKAGTCDAPDDPGWFSSIDDAGGPLAVTQVRVRVLDSLSAGTGRVTLYVTVVRTSSPLPVGTPVPFFLGARTVEAGSQTSAYNPVTNVNVGTGGRVLAVGALVRNTVTWDASSAVPGEVHRVMVLPTVTTPDGVTGVTAQDVLVTVVLPSSCVSYQVGSASLPPVSATPIPAGPCTGGTGSAGQTLVFDLGSWPVNTPVPAITFNTVVSPLVATPSTQTVTSTISSASDVTTESSGLRKVTSSIPVNALATFGVTKTASAATATPGDAFTYTIGWGNHLPTSAGTASFVDVLPFNGDSRGTTGLNGLNINSVTPSAADTTVWYTSDAALGVQAAVQGDPSGMTGISWSQTKPSTVTAIQFRTGELLPGTVQSAEVSVTPNQLSRAGIIKNDVWGKATGVPAPVQGASLVSMTSSAAELSGNVFRDLDYSFSKSVGDIGAGGVSVAITGGYAFGVDQIDHGGTGTNVEVTAPITVTTEANGDYVFPGVAPGRYSVAVVPPAGTHVAVSPTMPITLAADATVSGQDFGLQADLTPSVAKDDTISVGVNSGSNTIDVLANDAINDASAKITERGATSNGGTVVIAADGQSVSYTPAAGFVGDDTFTYTIADDSRQQSTATVIVHVVAAPAAQNDTAQTGEQRPVVVNVLANDSGVNLEVTGNGANSDGMIVINSNGTVTFTPNAGFSGSTSFTYTVTDSIGQTAMATVSITVVKKPVAQDDSATITQGAIATVSVLANDNATQPRVTLATTDDGTVTVNADNTVAFTPAAGFSGAATVNYTITDAVGQSASARITITVVPKPVAQDDDATTGQEKPVVIDVLSNDAGENLAVSVVTDPEHGTAVVEQDGRVAYSPAAGYSGADIFTYVVTDSLGQTATATVAITVVVGPVSVDDSALTKQDAAVVVDLLGNDVGDGIVLTSLGANADGTIADNGDGTVTFTPNPGFTGGTEFTYGETDQYGNTATGTVTIRVIAKPVAVDEYVTTAAGKPTTVDVLDNDSGSGLTVTDVDLNLNGMVTINAGGTVTFAPNAGFSGDTEVKYTVTDVVGQEASATIHIHVAVTPIANPDRAKTPQSTAVTVIVLGNDTGEALSVTGIGDPASPATRATTLDLSGGQAVLNDDGTIAFTPRDGYSGVVTIPYTVTDGIGQTSSSTLTVTVVKAPTAPDMRVVTKQDTAATVKPMDQVKGENASIVAVGASPNGKTVLNDDGTITFIPKKGFLGDATFTYTVVDDLGQATTATVTVTVIEAPIPPIPPTPTPSPPGETPGGGTGGGLVDTGSDIAGFGIATAVLLLLAGAAFVLARRRRLRES